jgi:hypothetical protein
MNTFTSRDRGDFLPEMSWKAIGQPEHNMLNKVGHIQVRQVTA